MTIQRQNSDPLLFIFCTAYRKRPSRVRKTFTGNGRTKQAHKAECDINNIMARFQRTGVLDFQHKNEPRYGDVTGIDFQSCQLVVARANSMFADLPARLRDRFENDPAKFLSFVQNERNRPEAEQLGLLKAQETPAQAGEGAQLRAEPPAREGGSTPDPKVAEKPFKPHRHGGGEGGGDQFRYLM